MIFSYLYSKGIIKNGDSLFNLWCWLSFRRWFQIIHIPYHFFMGIRYSYSLKQIFYFCLGCITGKIYDQQFYRFEGICSTYSNENYKTLSYESLIEAVKILKEQENREERELYLERFKTHLRVLGSLSSKLFYTGGA